ncbi:MAG: hypothetical protein ACRENB_00945, partial [Gemmatimonadales bacterium]
GGRRPAAPGAPAGAPGKAAQLRTGIQGVAPTLAGKLRLEMHRHPQMRSRLAEALRQDDPSRIGSIGEVIVVIPRP